MPTLAESLVNSAARPVTLRVRPDLTTRRHRYAGQAFWVVKEPIGLNYYRFHEEEYAILQMLDGHTSLQSIKERFESEFAPQKITFQDLQQFVGMLHRSGLVISEATGQGWQLKKRRDDKKWREFMGMLSNVFAVRFRGIDPERILTYLHRYTWWMFTATAVVCFLLFGLSALTLLLVQFDVFRNRLPSFHEFFGPANWIYLGVTMAVVKVLHEFGHGLSCKHFGGECHEMGAMLLVFTPALYCNVSDSWMLSNKWHRVFIGAAGMYVELILASIGTYIWWFSEPGLLNQLALSVMFICSVSTLLFNGNPLLRFDGYYILMDILEIPNLRQKSTEVLRQFMVEQCLGIEQPENPFLPQQNRLMFGLYTVAAVAYRWVVVFSILWFLHQVLKPYGLQVIGLALGMVGLFGLVVQPVYQMGKFFYMPGRMHQVKMWRVLTTFSVVAAIVAFVALVPLPYNVYCDFLIEARHAKPVYSTRPGVLADVLVEAEQPVTEGQPVARVRDRELELRLERLIGEKRILKRQLDMRERTPQGADRLSYLAQLDLLQKQIDRIEGEIRDLANISAPRDGVVLPAPVRPEAKDESTLGAWSGSLLAKSNLGAYIQPTDAICQIGDPSQLDAVLVIDQAETQFVSTGNEVVLLLDSFTGESLTAKIDTVSSKSLAVAPPALSTQAGGRLETETDRDTGMPRPLSTSYPARASLDNSAGKMLLGLRGRAKIRANPRTLGDRLYRYLVETFRFHM